VPGGDADASAGQQRDASVGSLERFQPRNRASGLGAGIA
jgi:hypothetical protein